ncbi:uncharacterized protein LOC136032258 [Artemia franciscana]|uniref:HAUS augmin-like complex subunit 3 N-terminal domain-containing protein n=1 Tax=Artemia franciscana TaxID=6661 RepID=A0AA88IDL7_ARTSF|nr:hypothetical protein QYM36_000599 [Artemia franciscana]
MDESTSGRDFYIILKNIYYPNIDKYDERSFSYLFENKGSTELLQWLKTVISDDTFVSKQELDAYEELKRSGAEHLTGSNLELSYIEFLGDDNLEETEEHLELELKMLEAQKAAYEKEKECLEKIKNSLMKGLNQIEKPNEQHFPRLIITSGVDQVHLPFEKLFEEIQLLQSKFSSESYYPSETLQKLFTSEQDILSVFSSILSDMELLTREDVSTRENRKVLYEDIEYIYCNLEPLTDALSLVQSEKAELDAEYKALNEDIQWVMFGGGFRSLEELIQCINSRKRDCKMETSSIEELKQSAMEAKRQKLCQLCNTVVSMEIQRGRCLSLFSAEIFSELSHNAALLQSRLSLLKSCLQCVSNQVVIANKLLKEASSHLDVTPSSDCLSYLSKSNRKLEASSSDLKLYLLDLTKYSQHSKLAHDQYLNDFFQNRDCFSSMSKLLDLKLPNLLNLYHNALERASFGRSLAPGVSVAKMLSIEKPIKDLTLSLSFFEQKIKILVKTQAKFQKDTGESKSLRLSRSAWVYFLTDPVEFKRFCRNYGK